MSYERVRNRPTRSGIGMMFYSPGNFTTPTPPRSPAPGGAVAYRPPAVLIQPGRLTPPGNAPAPTTVTLLNTGPPPVATGGTDIMQQWLAAASQTGGGASGGGSGPTTAPALSGPVSNPDGTRVTGGLSPVVLGAAAFALWLLVKGGK